MNADQMISNARDIAERLFDDPSEMIQRKNHEIELLQSRVRELSRTNGQQAETIAKMLSMNSVHPTLPQAELAKPDGATVQCPRCRTSAYVEFNIGISARCPENACQ